MTPAMTYLQNSLGSSFYVHEHPRACLPSSPKLFHCASLPDIIKKAWKFLHSTVIQQKNNMLLCTFAGILGSK
jgi:hypothetical protein